MRSAFLAVLTAALVALILPACSPYKRVTTEYFKDKAITIQFIHEVGNDGQIVKKNYQQPVAVSTEAMSEVLKALRYSDPVFMWKEKDRRIFSDNEVEQLAPQLCKAFASATSDQIIAFSTNTWKKDLIFGADKYSNGMVFLAQDHINWIFANINIAYNQEGGRFNGNPMTTVPNGVRLTEESGLTYFRPSVRKWYDPKVFPNWLVGPIPFPLTPVSGAPAVSEAVVAPPPVAPVAPVAPVTPAPVPAAVAPPAAPPPAPGKKKAASSPPAAQSTDKAQERLRRLKTMLDEKLISEEDYNQKKKEILKDL